LLDAHPRVRCFGELFFPPQYLFQYLEGRGKVSALVGKQAAGSKLVFQQLKWWTTASSPGSPGAERRTGGAPAFLRRLHHAGFTLILLDRRNLMLQALSLVHAQHNQFHYRPEQVAQFEPFSVDPAEVLTLVYMLDYYSTWTRAVLEDLPRVEVWYEDDLLTTSCRQDTAKRLFELLGVRAEDVPLPMVKITPDTVSERVLNYSDVEATFARTRFARFLDA